MFVSVGCLLVDEIRPALTSDAASGHTARAASMHAVGSVPGGVASTAHAMDSWRGSTHSIEQMRSAYVRNRSG